MTPYYHDEAAGIAIFLGDCREIMPTLEPVDLVFADPPYGNNTDYASYDDTPEALDGLVLSIMPLIMNAAPVALITPGQSNLWKYPQANWILCFASGAGVGRGPWGFTSWQPILAYGKDPYLANGLGCRPDTKLTSEAASAGGDHPCPKPLELMRWIITRGTIKEGQTVLDPFMGSGTTLRAAKDTGRKAIGIEIEERYCEIAAKRLAQEVLPLWPGKRGS